MLYSSPVCLLILFGIIHTGTCYKCYSCFGLSKDIPFKLPIKDLHPSSECTDIMKLAKMPTTECEESGMVCVKGVSTISSEVTFVIRGCLPPDECKDYARECYTCEGDLCNKSPTAVPSLAVYIIISTVLAKFFY